MSAHTPGPWFTILDSTREYIAVYAMTEAGTKVICPVKTVDEADAILIAAAPELLDELKALVADLVRLHVPVPFERLAIATALITKAEGR